MSDDQINIAIAEWCGVRPIPDGWMVYHPERKTYMLSSWVEEECKMWMKEHPKFSDEGWVIRRQEHYPDYCHDLNAIHEAESKIIDKPEVWNEYIRKVHWVFSEWVVKNLTVREQLVGTAIHATARQRSEALLRTLGLWKE